MKRNAVVHLVWIILLLIASPCFGNDPLGHLNPEEKIWLNNNHIVRVRIGNARPFMVTIDGKIQGIAIDYLTHIFKRNGIEFKYVMESEVSWPDALKYIEQHDVVDMVPTAKITNERKKHMIFTDEYIIAPWVIFTRSTDQNFISSIEDLKGKTVSVEEGFVIHKKLKQDYPEINLKVVLSSENNIEIPIRDLSTGLVDAYIGNLIMTTYIMQSKGYTNIKIAAPTPFGNHNQAMAIRDDWPQLAGIINKTLSVMTKEEHAAIRNRWLSIRYEYGISGLDILKWSFGTGAIAFLIILIILIWNKKLSKEIRQRKIADKKVKYSLREKETLLHEIHHRVKNNLAVISSLLSLQAFHMKDERIKDALIDSKNRIQTMAIIHETLYQSENLAYIDMNTYLSKLAKILFQNYIIGDKINLEIDAEDIFIKTKQASPIGLIINEFISNSLKYGFPENQKGKIKIFLKKSANNKIELIYMDNGIGIPGKINWKETDSLGLQLVKTIAEDQLDGTIELKKDKGTCFIIKFELQNTGS